MKNDKPTYQDLEQRISFLEQELRNKNEKLSVISSNFNEILQLAKTGYWDLDLVNNKLYWSDEIYKIFECSPQEFEATYEAFLSFIHPEDRDYVNNSYQSHITSKAPYNIIHRILLKNGSVKFVNERCKSDFDKNGKPLRSLGTVVDITDRMIIENELKYAKEDAVEKELNIQHLTSNFEIFFNTIDDFLFVIDEQGIILHYNKTVEKRLGFTQEELRGQSILTVHPPERRSETIEVTTKVMEGNLISFQIPLITKQGKQIYVETSVTKGSWNGKSAFYGVSKDITKLKISEEKFSTAFYLNPTACGISEANTGKYIEVNDAFIKLFGYTKEEIIGHSSVELQIMTKEIRSEFLSKADSLGRIFNSQAELKTKNGDVKNVLLSGQNINIQDVTYRYTVVYDVTEIHKAKEKAEENEKKFSIAFQSSPNVSMITKIDNGEILEANDAVEMVTGFSRSEIIGNSVINLNIWMIEGSRDEFIEILRRDKKVLNFESKFRKKSGEAFIGLISGQIIRIKNQDCLLSIIHDITDRKNAEIELLQTKEKVEESESKFKNLYESLSISYLIIKDGVYIECNEATLSIYGIDRKEEIIGKLPIDFSPEFQPNHVKSSKEAERHIKLAIEKGSHTFEWITMRKNKQEFYSEVSLKRFYHKNELYIQCLIADISERKRNVAEIIAAKELAEDKEKLLSDLINNSSSFIFLLDIEGKFLTVNNSLATFFNKPINEIIGCTREKLFPKEIAEQHLNNDRLVIANQKAISFEETAIAPDGMHYYYGQKFPLIDNSGKLYGVGGISTDITELKTIQNDLSIAKKQAIDNEHFLYTLINNLPDLVWLKDVNGVYLKCNKRFEEFIGATEHEIIGKTDYDFLNPDIVDFFRHKDIEAIEAGKPVINEELLTFASDKHSEYIETIKTPFYRNGQLIGVLGIGRNITERKNAELELLKAKEKIEESEIKFRQLAENLNDVVWLRKKDKIIYINPAFDSMYGISREIFIEDPKSIYNLLHPEDIQKYRDAIHSKEFFETGKFYCEYRIIKPQNDIHWIISKSSPVIDSNGNQTEYRVGFAIDITRLKKIENELIAAKEKAEESDRLKTAFLHNMSHEIRTPLNAICGFSEFLNDDELSVEKRNDFIKIIQNSSTQLLSIVGDILTISSLETKQEKTIISNVCINSCIVELLAIFNIQAINQNISLDAKQPLNNKQSEIYTDKTKITQILSNLLSNALKFTHEGFIEFGYNIKDEDLEFYVKDTGIGIKAEYQEKIFERFRQADKSINKLYGGTGLGLAISKAYVELLGGKIWVNSEIDKGSTFYFTIPYKPVNKIDKTISSIKQNENFKTIIIAEDEDYNYLLIKELLSNFKVALIHTRDGQETVDVFKSNPDIDLILMDIKMPILSGDEAAKIIKSIKSDMPIIAQSAYALEHERAKFEGIFIDYLTKPFKSEILIEIISQYIEIVAK